MGYANSTMTSPRRAEYPSRLGRFHVPMGYVDGQNLYEFVMDNPENSVDPTGLYKIDWYKGSGWTEAEKQKLYNSMGNVKKRNDQIIGQIDKYIAQLRGKKCDMSTPINELQKLKDILQKENTGITSDKAKLEFVKKDLGKPDVPLQHHYYAMPGTTNNIEFNTTAQTPWDTLPEYKLNELMMHELSHEYGTEDDDSKGTLLLTVA